MRNDEIADLLDQIAELIAVSDDNPFRSQAYQEAARTIRGLDVDVAEVWRQGQLESLHGIGESIAARIAEYLANGHSPYLADLQRRVPPGVLTLLQVPGIGPKKARLLAEKLQIRNIDDLIAAAEDHRIRTLPRMGSKTEDNLLREANRVAQRTRRLPLYVAWPLADSVAAELRRHPAVVQAEPAGSIRRRKDTIGDIDILVASTDAASVFQYVADLPLIQETLVRGPTKSSFLTRRQLQIDIRVVPPEMWGSALQYFTGSKAHNIRLRNLAIARGLKINEYGVFRVDNGQRLASETEADVYAVMGMPCMAPEIREDRGEIEAALAGKLPNLVELADIRGDLHTHTVDSDGRDTLAVMAHAAQARGYDWLAITDHSYGLPITKGLTEAKARSQRAAIDALNVALAPFRILQGVEVEIRADGTLDFDDAVLCRFEVVGASMHVGTKVDRDRNTWRLLSALADPMVDVLNHATGQVVGRRSPYDVDLNRVIQTAVSRGIALEINGSHRLDLSSDQAFYAHSLGAVFALSSDAHATDQLDGMRYAVALARRAWAEKHQVLNTFDAASLLAWIAQKRSQGMRRAA